MALVHAGGGEARAREKGIERVARSAPHIIRPPTLCRHVGVEVTGARGYLLEEEQNASLLSRGRWRGSPWDASNCRALIQDAPSATVVPGHAVASTSEYISAWCTGPRRSPTFGVQEACRIPHRQARDGRARFGRVVVEQPPAWERPATFVNDLLIAKPKTCLLCNNAWG